MLQKKKSNNTRETDHKKHMSKFITKIIPLFVFNASSLHSLHEAKYAQHDGEMKNNYSKAEHQDKKLLKAAIHGNLDQAREALQDGADINATDEEDHSTALIKVVYAVMGNYLDYNKTYLPILRYLLAQPKIDVNRQTKTTKNSALLLAVHFDNLEMVQELLGAEAALSLHDYLGETAASMASPRILPTIQYHLQARDLAASLFTQDFIEYIIDKNDGYSSGTQVAQDFKNIVREYLG